MPIFEFKGFNAKKGRFEEGTVRAADSKEAMENVLYKKFGGSGEVTVSRKRKDNGKEVQRSSGKRSAKGKKRSKTRSAVSN